MSATQKIAPRLQSLVNRIISTPGGIFKSWCQRNEALRQLPVITESASMAHLFCFFCDDW